MNVVIIGNGISGITAARWLRKLGDSHITVISSESDHFYSRTALMYIYMGHMRYEDTKPYEDHFWDKNRINLKRDHVDTIDFHNKKLSLSSGDQMGYDKLILAVGSTPNRFGWPGQDLDGVGSLYHLSDLETMERYSTDLQRAVIVGGGLIGVEMAEMFHSRHIPVTMLVRESSYWDNVLPPEESAMVTRHIKSRDIDLKLDVNLQEIQDNGTGSVQSVIVKETGEKIDCGYVGLTAGVRPNVAWLKDTELEINRGILVNDQLETNMPDVYAIGDCAEVRSPHDGRRGVEAIWYTGRMMGETVAYNIMDQRVDYNPGTWFNSAKFFDIEYQVYGHVPSHPEAGTESVYWEHPDGEKSVRIVYNAADLTVVGFNLMGVRYRHKVCEKWINEKTPLSEVMGQLELAHFDPEFYQSYSTDIIKVYEGKTGQKMSAPPRKKNRLNRVLQFLK